MLSQQVGQWSGAPLAWSFSRMDSASTAMQETISWDMTWPREFHTSHRLGPSMSMTCMERTLNLLSGFVFGVTLHALRLQWWTLHRNGQAKRGTHRAAQLAEGKMQQRNDFEQRELLTMT